MADGNLFEQIFQLKFTVKQLERSSKRAHKEELKKKAQVVQCIKKGNIEAARIHASDAIRKKSETLNFLKLAARVDGVRSRLETMQATKQVASMMAKVTQQLGAATGESLNIEKITQVMDSFERQVENVEVVTDVMDSAMNSATATLVKQDDVDSLIAQVADENSLELKTLLPEVAKNVEAVKQQQQVKANVAAKAQPGKMAANS